VTLGHRAGRRRTAVHRRAGQEEDFAEDDDVELEEELDDDVELLEVELPEVALLEVPEDDEPDSPDDELELLDDELDEEPERESVR